MLANKTMDGRHGRRQPMKALPIDAQNSEGTLVSPHDSLATGTGNTKGGTRYFLQFNNSDRSPTSKKSPVSSKKPVPLPKGTVSPSKKYASSPKKPASSSQKPFSFSKPHYTPTKSFTPSGSTTAQSSKHTNKLASPAKASSVTARSPVKVQKKQGPPVKPKPQSKIKSRIPVVGLKTESTRSRSPKRQPNDGFRTRSVSPKVLKREDMKTNAEEENAMLTTVVDKCNTLLKNLQTDRSQLSKALPVPKLVSSYSMPRPTSAETNTSILGQANEQPIASEKLDKRTNNCSNSLCDTTDIANPSQLVDTEPFIDLAENNQANTANAHCLALENNGQVSKTRGLEESTKEDRTPSVSVDTEPLEYRSISSIDNTRTSTDYVGEDLNQLDSGCQESTNLTNSEHKNLTTTLTRDRWNYENEPERDRNLDHGTIVGERSATHLTRLQAEEAEVAERDKALEQGELDEDLANSKTTMASSWMDRLKEVGGENMIY